MLDVLGGGILLRLRVVRFQLWIAKVSAVIGYLKLF